MGEISPPTKLPTFFFGIVITWIWVDPKHDIDLITRDFHPLDQCPDEIALARPIGRLQAIMECGREVLETANNQLQFPLQGGLIGERLALLLQTSEALAQTGHPGLKLPLVDEALGITVDQPGHALAQLADLAFNRGQRGTFRARLRLQTASIFLREPLRVREQRTDFLPHRQVQQIRSYLRILTEPLATKTVGVRAQAAVIGVRARFAFAGTRTEAFAIEGIATVLALQQALQQIQGAPVRLPGMALVLLQLLLNRGEHRGLHERWDRDRNPILWGDIRGGVGTAWWHGPVSRGAQPRPQRLLTRLAKRRCPLIGRILQDAPHHTPIPHGLARAGHFARLREPTTDLANGQAVVADPGKDLADQAGFVREDLIAGLPAPFVLGYIAVPIGGAAEHIHHPNPRGVALATSMALDDLGALILSNHPLHLQEQVIFWALPQGPVEEHDLHPGASELIDQEYLIGIFARQAIWRVHIKPIHTARRHYVAQALQRWAHQGGPTIPFIEKLHRLGHRQPLGGQALAQGRHLAGDSLGLGLLLGRDTCIDCYLGWIHGCCLPPTCCIGCASTACRAQRARGAGRRVMGTTRSYACTTQAALTRLGSNVIRTSRVMLPVCPRRATRASLHPWRGAFMGWHTLQRCPQKSIPIPGAQLCSWNTCRELYRQVGNFVGSVLSPVLMNLTLDGLQQCLQRRFRRTKARNDMVNMVRWADDFIITGRSKELLEYEVKPLVEAFLSERGLTLSPEKTHITHINEGFDFLGQHIRKYGGTYLAQPAKKNVQAFLGKVRNIIKSNKQATTGHLILCLNPVIRGWAHYHRHSASKRTFDKVDSAIFEALWRWAKRRHPTKPPGWVKRKYFCAMGNRHWVFHGDVVDAQGERKNYY